MTHLPPDSWYEVVAAEAKLAQGELIPQCPIIIPPPPTEITAGNQPNVRVEPMAVVVVSQSCDLEHGKLKAVLVAAYWPADDFLCSLPAQHRDKVKAQLLEGAHPAFHFMNGSRIQDHAMPAAVVRFRNTHGVDHAFLTEHVQRQGDRLRLLSPYREDLAQAFARYFMRVALPVERGFD